MPPHNHCGWSAYRALWCPLCLCLRVQWSLREWSCSGSVDIYLQCLSAFVEGLDMALQQWLCLCDGDKPCISDWSVDHRLPFLNHTIEQPFSACRVTAAAVALLCCAGCCTVRALLQFTVPVPLTVGSPLSRWFGRGFYCGQWRVWTCQRRKIPFRQVQQPPLQQQYAAATWCSSCALLCQ